MSPPALLIELYYIHASKSVSPNDTPIGFALSPYLFRLTIKYFTKYYMVHLTELGLLNRANRFSALLVELVRYGSLVS